MHCPNCGKVSSDSAAACPSCGHPLTPAAGIVATGALTPPDGLIPSVPGAEQVDELAQRLQASIGEHYKVEKPLGAGGFAVVYLVRDLNLKRRLAVKVLSPDLITSKTVLERFRREAETVAQLSHPHIVPLHFIGQKDDLLYLAMECIDGGSLVDRIEKEGKLPADDVVRITSEVASALAYAHKRGVIHRDIKPHNVLIEAETGRTLVTDFGIARTAEGSSLTASGMLVGTPAYLSPEQVTGAPTDHRADIYALGVMAYEMLTGQPPFTGPTPTAVLMKRLSESPQPITKLRPDVPPALRDAIDGMLAQNPEERFQTAMDVVRALGGATPASGGLRTSEFIVRRNQGKRRKFMFGAAAGAAAAATIITVLMLSPGGQPAALPPVDDGMVLIPGGSYTIGSDDGPRSKPVHQVDLEPFGIDRIEVTVGAYQVLVDSGVVDSPWSGAPPASNLPVSGVRWSEANRYCQLMHPPAGALPTEQQWEAAARGQEARVYPWGNVMELGRANVASERRSGPAPGGSYTAGATPEGVQDMIGNVWEWTRSPMAPYPQGAPIAGLTSGQYYVIRGGAFNSQNPTATARGYNNPNADRADLAFTGFRCAMPARQTPPQ